MTTMATTTMPTLSIDALKDRLPDHAKDLRINLGVIAAATALSPRQAWGTAITAAITARNPDVIAAIEAAAAAQLSPEALAAARGGSFHAAPGSRPSRERAGA